jgi:Flp pilus assembly protein TadG
MKKTPNLLARLRRILSNKRGNVLMIMGFALIPITVAAGMTVDYTRAARLKTKLDAAADAAVLSAVSEAGSAANDKTVCERAAAMFDAQARVITKVDYSKAASITLSVGTGANRNNVTYNGASNRCTDPLGAPSSAMARVVSMSYTVESGNFFGGILGRDTLTVSGQTGSETTVAPNIDFYVMMDTSPSMLFPTTQAAIDKMQDAIGCAFACHQGNQTPGVDGMRLYNGVWMDSYGVARQLRWGAGNNERVVFRYDAMLDGVSQLMNTAYASGAATEAEYRVVINNFDKTVNRVQNQIQISDGTTTFSTANRDAAAAAALTPPLYKPWINGTDKDGNPDNDQQTHFDSMMQALNASGGTFYIPTAGNGTNLSGDSPQKVLFIISDGFNEQSRFNNPGFGTIDVAKCTALKSRGIKIAILYLWVYPSGWSPGDNQAAASRVTLEQCASPDLYYPVKTGTNITTALAQLFQQSIAKPRLIR